MKLNSLHKLFYAASFAAATTAFSTKAQTVIANYPLTANSNDVSGNFGAMTYGVDATQAPSACTNGTSTSWMRSPGPAALLNTSNFQVSLTFKITAYSSSTLNQRPIFMLDNAFRAFSVAYTSTGAIGLFWNNSNFTATATILNLNQTYTLTAKYVAPTAQLLLDGHLIQQINVGTLNFSSSTAQRYFATYNSGNGQYGSGCISNLTISNNVALSLPINLTSFRAGPFGAHQALLSWATEHEFAGERFGIERSVDAKNWQQIGTVMARGLTTSSSYSFVDEAPVPGRVNYYRLSYVNLSGMASYTAVERVQMGDYAALPKLRLNPVHDVLTILNWQAGTAKVYDLAGRIVMPLTVHPDGTADVGQLMPGVYVLQIAAEGSRSNLCFQKL